MDNLLNKQPAQNEGLSAEPPAQSGQEVPKDEQKAPAEQENTLDTPQAAEEKTDTGTADGQSEPNLFDIINKKDENWAKGVGFVDICDTFFNWNAAKIPPPL